MAKTAAEYQRDYRLRKKAALVQSVDRSMELLSRQPKEYHALYKSLFEESLDAFGVCLNTASWLDPVQRFHSDGLGETTMSAIDRLQGLAGGFLDAAVELATFINAYKVAEAERARAQLIDAKYKTLAEQKAAVARIYEIDQVIQSLSRRHRVYLPVTGTNAA